MAICSPNSSAVQAQMNFRRGDRQFQNVFWFLTDGVVVMSDLEDIADSLLNWFFDVYRGFAIDDLALLNVITKQFSDGGLEHTRACTDTTCQGSNTAEPEPANVTATIGWRTGLRGRRNRGRSYLNGLATTYVNDFDQLISSVIAYMGNMAINYFLQGLPAGYDRIIYHCNSGTGTKFQSFAIDQNPDSQRRRLPGRGI